MNATEPILVIEITKTEADQLVGLLDQAVKAAGLVAAESAIPILAKLRAAHQKVSS